MSRGLVFSPDYNLVTTCWMMETGVPGEECDVLLMSGSAGLASRLAETGYFSRVFQSADQDSSGRTLSQRGQAIDAVLRNSGRPFRQKSNYMELLSPSRFYGLEKLKWDKYYSHSVGFESLFPQMEWILWKKGGLSFWDHSLIYSLKGTKFRALPSFYILEAKSLWFGLHDIAHPRDQLSEMLVTCPELISKKFRERLTVKAIPKIDKGNRSFIKALNFIFDANGVGAVFPPAVFFPRSIGIMQEFQTLEQNFLDQAVAILGEKTIAIKEHPSSIYESREPWRGAEPLQNAAIPWELRVLNYDGWDRRLLVSTYCTTALFTAKTLFDEEPFVLNLCRLFPEFNCGASEALHLELAREVGGLYRNPERYCIPETWDEVWSFLQYYAAEAL